MFNVLDGLKKYVSGNYSKIFSPTGGVQFIQALVSCQYSVSYHRATLVL